MTENALPRINNPDTQMTSDDPNQYLRRPSFEIYHNITESNKLETNHIIGPRLSDEKMHGTSGTKLVKNIQIEIVSSNFLPQSTIHDEKSLNTLNPTTQGNFVRPTSINYLTCEKQNQRMSTIESTTEFEESLNENKHEISTMILRPHLCSKVFSAGKSVNLIPKNKQLHHTRARNLTLNYGTKDSHISTNDQSGLSFKPRLGSETIDKVSNPALFSPSSQKYSSPLKQQSLKELNDIFDGAFSDNEEEDEYDKLNKTQRITFDDNVLINPITRANGNNSPSKAGRILSKISNGDAFANILGGLEDDNVNAYISQERIQSNKKITTLANMEEYSYSEILTRAIFNHDLPVIRKVLRKREFPIDLNIVDALGNTPLMLAIKLSYKNLDYLEIAKCLISYGADPRVKDENGWSCLDEAVCQADYKMLMVLLDSLLEKKKRALLKQKEDLLKLLDKTPDFYLEMKWDFESNIIPFVSKLAPSDTFKIWKYGKYIRMDYTLTGFKGLKTKRRNMSLIFNTSLDVPNGFTSAAPLFSINRDKNQYTNILQDIDEEEKKCIIRDLLKAEPIQGALDIKNCVWLESKGMFGTTNSFKINEWDTKKFDFKISMEYSVIKKTRVYFRDDHGEYMNLIATTKKEKAETARENTKPLIEGDKIMERARKIIEPQTSRSGSSHKKEKKLEGFQSPNASGLEPSRINESTFEVPDRAQISEKKSSGSVWFANNFPLKIQNFLPVLEFLSKGNNLLHKLESLLTHEESKPLMSGNEFPVKLQVPLTLSIKANVTMMTFKSLENVNIQEVFFLPKDCIYVNRKEAQKTLTRPKKGMFLINTLI